MRFPIFASVAGLLLLAAPLGLGHAILPLNAVDNPSFDSGWANWLAGPAGYGAMAIVGGKLYTPNAYAPGAFAHQYLAPGAPIGTTILFDFEATIVSGISGGGLNTAEVLGAWNPALGTGQITARVGFHSGKVTLDVWTANPTDANGVPAPTDGQPHHYQVLMVGAAGVGVLLIDNMPVLVATGDPASVGAPDRIIVGDVAYCDCSRGPAPNVMYDEFYYGAQL